MRSPLARHVGKVIRRGREDAAMSQAELAAALNTTHQTISRYELGWVIPDLPTLITLATVLGFSLADLEGVAA